VSATHEGRTESQREPISLELPAGTLTGELTLPEPGAWNVEASAKDFWSAPVAFDLPSQGLVDLDLWPAGKVTAHIHTPSHAKLPRQLELRLRTPDKKQTSGDQPDEAQVICQVKASGAAACASPAGVWDIRARAASFVPFYFWRKRLPANGSLNLGAFRMRVGTSVEGRVVTALGPADPKTTTVELHRIEGNGHEIPHETARRLSEMNLHGRINPQGYFNLQGVPAGSYRLEAKAPGFEPSDVMPLSVHTGKPVELQQDLILQPAARLAVTVTPAEHPLDGPWKIDVRGSEGGKLARIAQGQTDASGSWISPPIPQGRVEVFVTSLGSSGRAHSRLASKEVMLRGGVQNLDFDIPVVEVHGVVLRDSEPVSCYLTFGSGDQEVNTNTGYKGKFVTALPHAGPWTVRIHAPDSGFDSWGDTVDVSPPKGKHTADVEIDLPDTAIEGRVTNSAGNGILGATVTVLGADKGLGMTSVTSKVDGAFKLKALMPGRYELRAETRNGGQSATTKVVLDKGTHLEDLDLTIEHSRALNGRVTSGGTPVPGALAIVAPETESGIAHILDASTVHTDSMGKFSVELTGDPVAVSLRILAPGHVFLATRIPLGLERQPIDLELDTEEGGTLYLPRPTETGPQGSRQTSIVYVNSEIVGFGTLGQWSADSRGTLFPDKMIPVPDMPPGYYVYCTLSPKEWYSVVTGLAVPKAQACTSGDLASGGELKLTAPTTER